MSRPRVDAYGRVAKGWSNSGKFKLKFNNTAGLRPSLRYELQDGSGARSMTNPSLTQDSCSCQSDSSTGNACDFPQDPEAFYALYFNLDDGIICRAWRAIASELCPEMKVDFSRSHTGPRIEPPPYSVVDKQTGQVMPEHRESVKIAQQTLRYALTSRDDPTKAVGEISFLYPKIKT